MSVKYYWVIYNVVVLTLMVKICITRIMARIITYAKELRKKGEGYYIKDLGDGVNDYIIVANNKRLFDSFIFMRATAFSDMLAKCGYGDLAKDVREALFAIDEKNREFYRNKRLEGLRKRK